MTNDQAHHLYQKKRKLLGALLPLTLRQPGRNNIWSEQGVQKRVFNLTTSPAKSLLFTSAWSSVTGFESVASLGPEPIVPAWNTVVEPRG